MRVATPIEWRALRPVRDAYAPGSPDPSRWPPLAFPPPPPDRPWVFGVVVASADGAMAWRRAGPGDDPVATILGGETRPDRIADRRLLRHLRCIGDVGIGAQTLRDHPGLVLTPEEPAGDEPAPELYRFRTERGLSHHPRTIVYSLYGRLPREHPTFDTPGLQVIAVTTAAGEAELAGRGFGTVEGFRVVAEPVLDAAGLRRAHRRLRTEHGVRYLACEGGMQVLAALRSAGLLDEVFATVTDVVVDAERREGVLRIFDFEREGADLIAEGRLRAEAGGYVFRRWRFSQSGGP